jgi:hypothetical protein
MNNLAYNSQDPAVVGPKVEEKVREDVGASAPLTYEVESADGSGGGVSVGSVLRDMGRSLVGGNDETVFSLHFDLQQPRPTRIRINMNRQGVGTHAGLVLFSSPISKSIAGEVALEDPKFFGKSKFAGDGAASAKLNGNGDLIKRANDLAKVESESGGLTLKIQRCCKVIPHEGGSLLVVATLPQTTKMGFSATIHAKEFFELANLVEATL